MRADQSAVAAINRALLRLRRRTWYTAFNLFISIIGPTDVAESASTRWMFPAALVSGPYIQFFEQRLQQVTIFRLAEAQVGLSQLRR